MLKECNTPQHYRNKHSSQYFPLTGKQQLEKLDNSKWNILSQKKFTTKRKKNRTASKVIF